MPFNRPTLSQLLDRVRGDFDARLPGSDSRLRRSVLDVLARMHSGAINGLYGFLDWISRQILPDTSEAAFLERQAAIWAIRRKAATPARGETAFAGVNGSVIPAGTELVRSDGVGYVTIAEGEIAAGAAAIAVEAAEPGLAGNAVMGQLLQLVSPVAGVQSAASVTNGDLAGGAEEEDDEALRARLLDRIRRPPHGGSASDYERWALEVPGVTRAWVYPGELGPGTVKLIFVIDGRADIIPDEDEVQVVQAYIDPLRPVTAALTVVAPIPLPLDLTLRVAPATAAVKAAIEAELADLVAREAEPGGTLLISHIREAISLAAGEYDHELIDPVGNVETPTGYLLVMGEVTWVGG